MSGSKVFGDRWTVKQSMKATGQGQVHRVTQPEDSNFYALKELHRKNGDERFVREIKVMRRLHEAGVSVPEVVDAAPQADVLYFVMPWFKGGSLQAVVSNKQYVERLEPAVVLAVELAKTLQVVHRHGIAHRDLKPANVLLRDGDPWLADFGIALDLGEDRLTFTNEPVGPRRYLAPEADVNGRNEDYDHRPGDFYSFGMLVWAMLTGDFPPRDMGPEYALGPRFGPDFNRLDALLTRLTQPEQVNRLQDWSAVISELEGILAASSTALRRPRPTLNLGDLRAVPITAETRLARDALRKQEVRRAAATYVGSLFHAHVLQTTAALQQELDLGGGPALRISDDARPLNQVAHTGSLGAFLKESQQAYADPAVREALDLQGVATLYLDLQSAHGKSALELPVYAIPTEAGFPARLAALPVWTMTELQRPPWIRELLEIYSEPITGAAGGDQAIEAFAGFVTERLVRCAKLGREFEGEGRVITAFHEWESQFDRDALIRAWSKRDSFS